jgi:hypothetical protein
MLLFIEVLFVPLLKHVRKKILHDEILMMKAHLNSALNTGGKEREKKGTNSNHHRQSSPFWHQ